MVCITLIIKSYQTEFFYWQPNQINPIKCSYICASSNIEMKKLLLVIILLFGFLILSKQYHYHHNIHIQTELNIPIDLANHHIDVHNGCHEYFAESNENQSIQFVQFKTKSVCNFNVRPLQPCFYIWQPPEFSC